MKTSTTLSLLLVMALAAPALAENVIVEGGIERTAPAIRIDAKQALEVIDAIPAFPVLKIADPEALRIARKLDAHLLEFIEGYPYKPFHNVLGISGFETLFDHPDRVFYAVSLALPYVPQETAAKAKALLSGLLASHAPYAAAGLPYGGNAREAYEVPEGYRRKIIRTEQGLFGVYAFWTYVHLAGDAAAAKSHWPAIQARVQPVLAKEYVFDPAAIRKSTKDEPQRLNADLAGLIAYVRLARLNGDSAAERQGIERATQLLELRINHDRVNPNVLEKSTASASKSLHNAKLARYCDLTPEVALALQKHTDGLAAARLKAFRAERNAWYLAFGERLIGGENYISPAHMAHAMFNGAALVEGLDAASLLRFIDIPWCRGDLYFIEKCALALRAAK